MHVSAEDVIEQLRFGLPPSGVAYKYTVGRDSHIRDLTASLEHPQKKALLILANYGAGKSHLLRVLREIALDQRFVVALIIADAQGDVRFNRMDTVFGSICRSIEVPGSSKRGVGLLFDAYTEVSEASLSSSIITERNKISNGNRWDVDERYRLWAPGIYVALRAWVNAGRDSAIRDRVDAWLSTPTNHRGQRRDLYRDLVSGLSGYFHDPRPQWQFMSHDVFSFHTNDYRNSWAALRDIDFVARCSGYNGLVVLVDEFEDVIYNLVRIDYKQQAFRNLFRFFSGKDFPGRSYFAVTPDFTQKCKLELWTRGIYDYDERRLDSLPCFRLDPLSNTDLFRLAKKIRAAHSVAYGWTADQVMGDSELRQYCDAIMMIDTPDKTRRAVISVVELLDDRLNDG